MTITKKFTFLRVHQLAYQDDFCDFAMDVRQELLAFPDWSEMRQDGHDAKHILDSERQNGITTGHLSQKHNKRLPHCLTFAEVLRGRLEELCALEGVECEDHGSTLSLEINAMAYGEGAWLSAHTDSGTTSSGQDRLIAWMLYLTHPDDGEWEAAKGGSVRLWDSAGAEVRLSPKFNRFAMFKVSKHSDHEIEKISWHTGWERCRLALSGWVRGVVQERPREMSVYLQSADYETRRAEVSGRLEGALALYRLMLGQQQYCGADTSATFRMLEQYSKDYQAHLDSPAGTSFVQRSPGPRDCITIVDEQHQFRYVGPVSQYSEGGTVGAGTATPEGVTTPAP